MIDTTEFGRIVGGPAMTALAIAMAAIGVLLMLRRRLVGGGGKNRVAEARKRRERIEREADQQVLNAISAPTRRSITPSVVAEHVHDFRLASFESWARDLFRRLLLERRTLDPAELRAQVLPGAAEVALSTGIGLEEVHGVHLIDAQLTKANGTADGCAVTVRFTALLDESRNGERVLFETCESWAFGWPPAHAHWRLVSVDRHWRRALAAPVANPNAANPATKPQLAPDLAPLLEEHQLDSEAIAASAQLAAEAWAEAVRAEDPARLGGLATPAFEERVATELLRHTRFERHLHWELAIDEARPARVLTDGERLQVAVWVTGTSTLGLDGPEQGERYQVPYAAYLELVRDPDGGWLLHGVTDPDHWVV